MSIFVNCQAVSFYLHAEFGLGCVASLAIIRVIHNQGNTGREGEGIVGQNIVVLVIKHSARC